MRLTIDGVNWPVQEVIPMDSAGFVISWLVKVSTVTYKGNDHGTC